MNKLSKEELDQANLSIDGIDDITDGLDRFSVEHDDLFSSEVYEIRELVKRARRLLQ